MIMSEKSLVSIHTLSIYFKFFMFNMLHNSLQSTKLLSRDFQIRTCFSF